METRVGLKYFVNGCSSIQVINKTIRDALPTHERVALV